MPEKKAEEKDLEELWENEFGKKTEAVDFAGRKIKKTELRKKTQYGANCDHILPKDKGGKDIKENKQIVHFKTNEEKDNNTTFNISDECGAKAAQYQVKKRSNASEEELKKIPYKYDKQGNEKKYVVVFYDNKTDKQI